MGLSSKSQNSYHFMKDYYLFGNVNPINEKIASDISSSSKIYL